MSQSIQKINALLLVLEESVVTNGAITLAIIAPHFVYM
jgi:hypothetical protein